MTRNEPQVCRVYFIYFTKNKKETNVMAGLLPAFFRFYFQDISTFRRKDVISLTTTYLSSYTSL
jgi:hypothetical protein